MLAYAGFKFNLAYTNGIIHTETKKCQKQFKMLRTTREERERVENLKKFPTDDDLMEAVKANNIKKFSSKIDTAYIQQLRFTDTNWNILHLVVYYQRKRMVNSILELSTSALLIKGKDRNGDTPLHLACFLTNAEIALRLLEAGATFYSKNYYNQDPIESVHNFMKKKALLRVLLQNSNQMDPKEIKYLRQNARTCDYLESMAEIVFVNENRQQFMIDRGIILKQSMPKVVNMRKKKKNRFEDLKQFKMGFRTKENFYLDDQEQNQGGRDFLGRRSGFDKENIMTSNYMSPIPYEFNEVPKTIVEDSQPVSRVVDTQNNSRPSQKKSKRSMTSGSPGKIVFLDSKR